MDSSPISAQSWIQIISTVGGMGAVAYALFLLHRESIRSFVKELGEERRLFGEQMMTTRIENAKLWDIYMQLKLRQHEQVIATLQNQDKSLERIEGNQHRIMDFVRPMPKKQET